MKKLFTLSLCALALNTAVAQTIDNSSLETWVSYSSMGAPLQRPQSWYTSDSLIRFYKLITAPGGTFIPQVTKEPTLTHSGTAAAKLTTVDTLPGLLSNANFKVDLSTFDYSFIGGTATSMRTASASAWLRYTPAGTDEGSMMVYAIKDGFAVGGGDSTIGEGYTTFGNMPAFAEVMTEIIYKDAMTVPDRIVVVFSSSSDNPQAGSVLYVDDVSLTSGTGITIPAVNQSRLSVYPNPASGFLQVNTDFAGTALFSIYDLSGRCLISQTMNGATTVSLNALAAGHYIYVLRAADKGTLLHSAAFDKQ